MSKTDLFFNQAVTLGYFVEKVFKEPDIMRQKLQRMECQDIPISAMLFAQKILEEEKYNSRSRCLHELDEFAYQPYEEDARWLKIKKIFMNGIDQHAQREAEKIKRPKARLKVLKKFPT